MEEILRFVRLGILIGFQFFKRHLARSLPISLLLLLLIFLQFKFNLFSDTQVIRIGIVGTYQEHDLPIEVTRLLSSSLVEADPNGKVVAKIIKGWETSSDATVFKFKLKDNIYWIDGTKILAQDISPNIGDIETSNPNEGILQFKLKESYSPLPSLLTKPVFKKGTLLGTGPYRAVKVEKSKIFITKITLIPPAPSLPKVYIRFYPNEKVAITGFNIGEVQVLLGLSNSSFASQNPKAKLLTKTDFEKIVTLDYFTKDPLLSNRSFRQALSFQAPEIEGEDIANNPFPKKSWAFDPQSKKYLNNTKEAQLALKRAKSSIDSEKFKEELTLTTTPNLEDVAKKVATAWRQLGLNIKIRVESGIPQNFQILLITQSIPSDPDQYFLWHSTQEKTNLSKYSSARVDKDLEDGRKTADEEIRKNKYFDFQKTLLEDAPATFLYFPKYNIVYLKKVEKNLNKVLSNKLLPLQFPD